MTTEDTTRCRGNDPACPCQDGDVCHYADDPKTSTAAWPIPNEAQRVTTTEDNEDQEALRLPLDEELAGALQSAGFDEDEAWVAARTILLALSGAGYTVVKTEDVRWEYGLVGADGGSPVSTGSYLVRRGEYGTHNPLRRRTFVGPWEPVPESDTLGGGANG